MKTSAREIWWPSLARLQAAHYIAQGNTKSIANVPTGSGEGGKRLAGLLKQLEAFGASCGLDAEKEQGRLGEIGDAIVDNWKWAWTTNVDGSVERAVAMLESHSGLRAVL